MLKLKLQYFGHLMWRATHLKRTWCWERLRAGGEGDDRGWDGWMASLIQWTWVWVNSGSWWLTGRPGVLWFMGLQSQTRLSDWTELNWGHWGSGPLKVLYKYSSRCNTMQHNSSRVVTADAASQLDNTWLHCGMATPPWLWGPRNEWGSILALKEVTMQQKAYWGVHSSRYRCHLCVSYLTPGRLVACRGAEQSQKPINTGCKE